MKTAQCLGLDVLATTGEAWAKVIAFLAILFSSPFTSAPLRAQLAPTQQSRERLPVGTEQAEPVAEEAETEETTDEPASDADDDQLRAVVRVSWRLIDAFADDQVAAEVPFRSSIQDGVVTGQVNSKVDLTIEPLRFQSSSGVEASPAVFRVRAAGNARGRFAARSGRFRISGPISVPFSAERAVSFDGRYFKAEEATVTASVNTCFQSIRTCRSGPLGRAVARIATPAILRERAGTERNAGPVARRYVSEFIDRYTADVVAQLNEVTPIERSLFKLYPEMRDWRIRVSTDGDYLEARYAPPDSRPVELPQAPHRDAGIEIWIRTTAPEAKFLERVGQWQQTQSLLKKYLPEEGSDAGKLTSETKVAAFGPWFAILIGRLQAGDAAAETLLPASTTVGN